MDFEKAFGDFIDRKEYDEAETALFSIIRLAFSTGWLAAGGELSNSRRVLEGIRRGISHSDISIETCLFKK